jgi:hypothetical protein
MALKFWRSLLSVVWAGVAAGVGAGTGSALSAWQNQGQLPPVAGVAFCRFIELKKRAETAY